MVKKKTCVFISGEGTNFKKILHRSKTEYNFPINLNLLVSNNIDAKGLKLAKKFDLPSIYIKRNKKNSFIVDVFLLNELKKRQINLIEKGDLIEQQTRLFDPKKGQTRSMRSKEDSHDYRYFPDPDLLPLEVSDEFVNKLKSEIPELPDDKKKRFINEFKLSAYEATILVSDIDIAKYFEEVVAKMGKNKDMKLAVNWITGELFAVLNSKNLEITQSPVSAKNLAILVNLIKNGTISGKIAKTVFELMLKNDEDPQKIVEEKGLKQQSDPKALEELIDKIINNNREKAIEYKQGKEKLFGFFVGQAMKASGGKANPQLINEILKKKL